MSISSELLKIKHLKAGNNQKSQRNALFAYVFAHIFWTVEDMLKRKQYAKFKNS